MAVHVPEWFCVWLLKRTNKVMQSREPDFIIGGRDAPYMKRWWLIPKNPLFNIYLHKMLRDDDDSALHDHPWVSFSIMLHGTLWEVDKDGCERIKPGQIRIRSARYAHRLAVGFGTAKTIFITGPKMREWGFHCPKGWRVWHEFTAKDDAGQIGRGCD